MNASRRSTSPFTKLFHFPDTDKYFGSSGSFYDLFPSSGSFVAHPQSADVHTLITMYTHIANIMQQGLNALSFIVCVRHNPAFNCVREIPGLGPYVRHAELLHRNQHLFEVGRRHKVYQKTIPLGLQLWSSTHDTVVYWYITQLSTNMAYWRKICTPIAGFIHPIIEKRVEGLMAVRVSFLSVWCYTNINIVYFSFVLSKN